MADYQENVSSCLPFYDLTDREFHAMVGSWPDRRHDLDLYDLLPNPNKFDECDPDLMLNTPCSEYYSVRLQFFSHGLANKRRWSCFICS